MKAMRDASVTHPAAGEPSAHSLETAAERADFGADVRHRLCPACGWLEGGSPGARCAACDHVRSTTPWCLVLPPSPDLEARDLAPIVATSGGLVVTAITEHVAAALATAALAAYAVVRILRGRPRPRRG